MKHLDPDTPLPRLIATVAVREAAKLAEVSGPLGVGVEQVAARMVTQDPLRQSWRIWGAVWSALTAVLVLPEVQAGITAAIGHWVPPEYLPIATAVLGVIWPVVSKLRDPRPLRT